MDRLHLIFEETYKLPGSVKHANQYDCDVSVMSVCTILDRKLKKDMDQIEED